MEITPKPGITQEEMLEELANLSHEEFMAITPDEKFAGLFETFAEMKVFARNGLPLVWHNFADTARQRGAGDHRHKGSRPGRCFTVKARPSSATPHMCVTRISHFDYEKIAHLSSGEPQWSSRIPALAA